MRNVSRVTVAVAIAIVATCSSALAQDGGAKDAPKADSLVLTQADLDALTDAIDQISKADADVQTARLFAEAAQAKAERAAVLLEARRLHILGVRHLSPDTHEVAFVPGKSGQPGTWVIRPKQAPPKVAQP